MWGRKEHWIFCALFADIFFNSTSLLSSFCTTNAWKTQDSLLLIPRVIFFGNRAQIRQRALRKRLLRWEHLSAVKRSKTITALNRFVFVSFYTQLWRLTWHFGGRQESLASLKWVSGKAAARERVKRARDKDRYANGFLNTAHNSHVKSHPSYMQTHKSRNTDIYSSTQLWHKAFNPGKMQHSTWDQRHGEATSKWSETACMSVRSYWLFASD